LLVNADGIETGVHDVHPAVAGAQDEQGHQGLAQIIEVVLAVRPHVARYTAALIRIADALDILALAVVEGALEQLDAQDAEDDEEGAADQDDVADGTQGR